MTEPIRAPLWFHLDYAIDGPQRRDIDEHYAITTASQSLKELAACETASLERRLSEARDAAPSSSESPERQNGNTDGREVGSYIQGLRQEIATSSQSGLDAINAMSDVISGELFYLSREMGETTAELKHLNQKTDLVIRTLSGVLDELTVGNRQILRLLEESIRGQAQEIAYLAQIRLEINQQYHQRLRDIKTLGKTRLRLGIRNVNPLDRIKDYQDALASFNYVVTDSLGCYDAECWFDIGWIHWKLYENPEQALESFLNCKRYCNVDLESLPGRLAESGHIFYSAARHAAHMAYLMGRPNQAYAILLEAMPTQYEDIDSELQWEFYRYAAMSGNGDQIAPKLADLIVRKKLGNIFLMLEDPDFGSHDPEFPFMVARIVRDTYLKSLQILVKKVMRVMVRDSNIAMANKDKNSKTEHALVAFKAKVGEYLSWLEARSLAEFGDLISAEGGRCLDTVNSLFNEVIDAAIEDAEVAYEDMKAEISERDKFTIRRKQQFSEFRLRCIREDKSALVACKNNLREVAHDHISMYKSLSWPKRVVRKFLLFRSDETVFTTPPKGAYRNAKRLASCLLKSDTCWFPDLNQELKELEKKLKKHLNQDAVKTYKDRHLPWDPFLRGISTESHSDLEADAALREADVLVKKLRCWRSETRSPT